VGGFEAGALASVEPTLRYHSLHIRFLTDSLESGVRTMPGGQFDWGGRLLKGNGGAQRSAQRVWKPRKECKGISRLNCIGRRTKQMGNQGLVTRRLRMEAPELNG
jgi:hypothetical protein